MKQEYFENIEMELNSMIQRLAENMVNAVNDKEWEAVHPTASGNLHRIMSGKFNGDRPMDNSQLFG